MEQRPKGQLIYVVASGTYDCLRNNPCTMSNAALKLFYFAYADPTKYVQCDDSQNCFIQPCPPGLNWNQSVKVCTFQGTTPLFELFWCRSKLVTNLEKLVYVMSRRNILDSERATPISRLHLWCCNWQLSVNVGKCHVLHIGKTNHHYAYFLMDVKLLTPVLYLILE